MKRDESNDRKKSVAAVIAIVEGLWNGVVISGVLVISTFLVRWALPT